MTPFAVDFEKGNALVSQFSGPLLDGGDPIFEGARAFTRIEILRKFIEGQRPADAATAPPLMAQSAVEFPVDWRFAWLFNSRYTDLTLGVGRPLTLDTPRCRFRRDEEQREVYIGELNLQWRRLTHFLFWNWESSGHCDIKGVVVMRFPPDPKAPNVDGFFLGVMNPAPPALSPRIMITFGSELPRRVADPDLFSLRGIRFFGNFLQGKGPEVLGPGFGESEFPDDEIFTFGPPGSPPGTGPAGTERVRPGKVAGGFGFGGVDGAVAASAVKRVRLELMGPQENVVATSSTTGERITSPCYPSLSQEFGAKIRDIRFLGTEDEEVDVDWWYGGPPCQCRFRVSYTLEGVLCVL